MGLTEYPNGFPYGVSIRGLPLNSIYSGKVFWVDSVHGSANNNGTFDHPLSSIARALTKCVASRGDIIMCKAGHIETVSTATSCVLSVIGVCIVFLGSGANRATIKPTATGAYVSVTAAGVSLINPRFLTGIDAVAKGINVAAADFAMVNAEYYDDAAKASTIQVLTTSAAVRLYIDGYKYFVSTTGTQKTDGIKTVGDIAGAVLKNIDIRGDFSTSPVNVSAAVTNLQLENIYANNLSAGPNPALTLHANTTGFAKNVKARVASGTTYVSSVAKLSWAADCEGFNTDGYGGDPIGTQMSSGIEGKVDSVGVQASTINNQASVINNQASAAIANTLSVISQATSIGIGTSTIASHASAALSQVGSVGAQASTISTGVSANASQIGSQLLGTTSILSTLGSLAERISLIASKEGL